MSLAWQYRAWWLIPLGAWLLILVALWMTGGSDPVHFRYDVF